MKLYRFAATAFGALLAASPVYADAETDALRKEVKALMARIDQLEKREKTHEAGYAAPARAVPAGAIDKRLAIVERNQELAQEDAKAKAQTAAKVEVGNGKGFSITSADKQYSVGVRGYAQVDERNFMNKKNTGATNTFLVRTARPIIDAKMTDYFNARLMWDFGQGNSRLLDAYADFHPLPGNDIFNLRIGEQKIPVGIERWESEQDTMFVERGQTTNLVPQRELGVMANGKLLSNQLEYQIGVFNGASDLQINAGDTDNGKDVAGRLFAYPLTWSGSKLLSGLGVGVGGTYGQHQGSAAAPGLTTGYLTPAQRTYFAYRSATGQVVYADGQQWRLNPQMLYYNGPFGFIGEYVRDTQQVARSGTNASLTNDAWLANVGYVLTGEDAAFEGVKPNHNFNPAGGDWGAFETVGRFSKLDVDKKAFPFFADNTVSARSAREWSLGGTWYLNQNVKFNLDYAWTVFDGGAPGAADKPDEKAILARTQFRF